MNGLKTAVLVGLSLPAWAAAQESYRTAVTDRSRIGNGPLRIELLVDSATLGGTEVELAELTFPPGAPGGMHRHGTNELLYVIEGELDHIVNGDTTRLSPGMVGIVRRGDAVSHRVASPGAVRVLVIWAPGGEAARLAAGMGRAARSSIPTIAGEMEKLRALREGWMAAYDGGAVEPLRDMYTEGAVRMPYDAPAVRGRDSIVAAYGQAFATRRMRPHIVLTPERVEITGDVAIERGAYDEVLTAIEGGRQIREIGKYVSIIRRGADGKWRFETSIFNRDAR